MLDRECGGGKRRVTDTQKTCAVDPDAERENNYTAQVFFLLQLFIIAGKRKLLFRRNSEGGAQTGLGPALLITFSAQPRRKSITNIIISDLAKKFLETRTKISSWSLAEVPHLHAGRQRDNLSQQ